MVPGASYLRRVIDEVGGVALAVSDLSGHNR